MLGDERVKSFRKKKTIQGCYGHLAQQLQWQRAAASRGRGGERVVRRGSNRQTAHRRGGERGAERRRTRSHHPPPPLAALFSPSPLRLPAYSLSPSLLSVPRLLHLLCALPSPPHPTHSPIPSAQQAGERSSLPPPTLAGFLPRREDVRRPLQELIQGVGCTM